MGSPHKHRFWRICQVYFRRVRITVWFITFLVLGGLIYLNQVGLPDFVKKPLLGKLRQRGLDLQFSRLRLRWYQGIVADNVRFESANEPLGPRLGLAEVQVLLNFPALAHFQLQVDALVLRRGRLVWPIADTNQAPRDLSMDNIEAKLRFLPADQWALDHFKATFARAQIRLSGMVTNASALRQWRFVQETQPLASGAAAWQVRLRRVADTLEGIHFTTPPELMVDLRGDARNLQSFNALIMAAAPGADTPWGDVASGRFVARLLPTSSNGLSRAELRLEAASVQSRWAAATNFVLHLRLSSNLARADLVKCDLDLSAENVRTDWARGSHAALTARWVHSTTNPVPISGQGQLQCETVETKWGTGREVHLNADLASFWGHEPLAQPDPPWGWWTNLQRYSFDWELHAAHLQAPELQTDTLDCGGTWRWPLLTITNLQVNLDRGQLKARVDMDIVSRALRLGLSSDVDLQKLAAVLPEAGRRWLDQFVWVQPPSLKGNLSLVLPAWTNQLADWRAEVLPTVNLAGELDVPRGGSYQDKLQVSSARSHFVYSNMTWRLPDLTLRRPEGCVLAEHWADGRTRHFYWHVTSTVDVRSARPLMGEDQQRSLDLFNFTEPPILDAEVWGRYHEPERVGFKARVALANFTFRGESITALQTSLQYTNQLLEFFHPSVQCSTQLASADGLAADFSTQLIFLTNGSSTVNPGVIARAIGPHVARAIDPYQFMYPPSARVYGTIPMRGEEGADLHFDLDGGPFHWWRLNVPHVVGHVHWTGQYLTLTDVRADFHGGQAAGVAKFDFRPQPGTDFQFAVGITNLQLQSLMADLSTQTNHLEGWLSGALSVTKANSEDWRTVNGYGEVHLRDGLIWDIPLFGIFSPILNGISPGLGNSRASAGACSFVITNGFIFSNDLEIRSTAMRLKYRGTVDLQSSVNARVEAEVLRDVWGFGPVVSAVFWPVTKMFEYKVSNTLSDPKTEPVFILPKLILLPFHPFRALRSLLPEDSAASRTNPPPLPR